MKSAIEILKTKIDYDDFAAKYPMAMIVNSMIKYAEQAIDKAAEVADADITFLGNLAELHDIDPYVVGEDYEVYVINSSILDVKKLLK